MPPTLQLKPVTQGVLRAESGAAPKKPVDVIPIAGSEVVNFPFYLLQAPTIFMVKEDGERSVDDLSVHTRWRKPYNIARKHPRVERAQAGLRGSQVVLENDC
jgi:hypothetical protein